MTNPLTQSRINKLVAGIKSLEHEKARRLYYAKVTTGQIAPDSMAYLPIGGRAWVEADVATTEHAYTCGYLQGWQCTFGGNLEVPTPPVGLDKARTNAFAFGVLAGENDAREGLAAGSKGRASHVESHADDALHDLALHERR